MSKLYVDELHPKTTSSQVIMPTKPSFFATKNANAWQSFGNMLVGIMTHQIIDLMFLLRVRIIFICNSYMMQHLHHRMVRLDLEEIQVVLKQF